MLSVRVQERSAARNGAVAYRWDAQGRCRPHCLDYPRSLAVASCPEKQWVGPLCNSVVDRTDEQELYRAYRSALPHPFPPDGLRAAE